MQRLPKSPSVPKLEGGWYAVQVRPHFERFVARLLQGKGYESFVPLYVERRRWSDRTKMLELPLISNYVFSFVGGGAVGPIVTTPGVVRLVGAGPTPIPIAPHELESLRRIDGFRQRTQPWPYLREGQTVEIQGGPLDRMRGVLLRVKNASRLVVSVTLLQRSVAVELDADTVFAVLGEMVA